MKITEYPQATEFDVDDVLLKDGANGTKKIKASDMAFALFDGIPEMHNQIFRGKNLGSQVTENQYSAIRDGSFSNLWLGDYWEIDNVKYRIADIDYYYCFYPENNYGTRSHHLVLVPDSPLQSAVINPTFDTADSFGFDDTSMYKTTLPSIKSNLASKFNLVDVGVDIFTGQRHTGTTYVVYWQKGHSFVETSVMLMDTVEIGGRLPDKAFSYGAGANLSDQDWYLSAGSAYSLFQKEPKFITVNDNAGYWTRLLSGFGSDYIFIGSDGIQSHKPMKQTSGVRPFIVIG